MEFISPFHKLIHPCIHPFISQPLPECPQGPHCRNAGAHSESSTGLGLAFMSQGPEKAGFADKLSIYDSLPGDSAADKMEEGVLCLETMKFTSGQGLECPLTRTVDKPHEICKPFTRPTVLGSILSWGMESCEPIQASQELLASTLVFNLLVGSRHCDLGVQGSLALHSCTYGKGHGI